MKILDACCGGRMFWFDKQNPFVTYMDNRELDDTLCDGRHFTIMPDIIADFRNIPFDDKTFNLVVFDPPHLLKIGENSWMAKKYGKLNPDTWKEDIKIGFSECFRVLKDEGFLVFKWNETDIKTSEILKLAPVKPLIGHKSGKYNKTHWLLFVKQGEAEAIAEQWAGEQE
ncbi:class I SAM-dependent methyltransferase [Anaerotruncus sp. 80]|uniref:Class I SAM-dependent methyltransferase n=1 Tax=Anaerotruncus colihominis TaxID=169435 RepID=A0A845QKN2_9FIRM|nr:MULTISPECIES: class I SAM-dependent methyltransferase [Anaerotruncus]NBH61994.1 class I SAM-dependent methyltransferase [Anaerotruncus colihominis]NCF02649.1 class I SAM-dependent methyltransferase [Anaerotruncus sp. 80]